MNKNEMLRMLIISSAKTAYAFEYATIQASRGVKDKAMVSFEEYLKKFVAKFNKEMGSEVVKIKK